MDILIVLFRWVHIGAAAYWFAVGGYQFLLNRDEMKIEYGTVVKYYAALGRVSKLALGMPIAAILTTLAGVALYGVLGYHNRGFATLGSIVFHIGVLAGVIAFIQGATQIARASTAVSNALKTVDLTNTTQAQVDAVKLVYAAMEKTLTQHMIIIVVAFLCMTAGTAIP
jgi:hypothetical protein